MACMSSQAPPMFLCPVGYQAIRKLFRGSAESVDRSCRDVPLKPMIDLGNTQQDNMFTGHNDMLDILLLGQSLNRLNASLFRVSLRFQFNVF